MQRTGTGLYRQASGGFPPKTSGDLPPLTAVDSGPLHSSIFHVPALFQLYSTVHISALHILALSPLSSCSIPPPFVPSPHCPRSISVLFPPYPWSVDLLSLLHFRFSNTRAYYNIGIYRKRQPFIPPLYFYARQKRSSRRSIFPTFAAASAAGG